MTPDPTHPRTWAAVRELAFALEAAAYRHGGTSSADVLGVEWTEAGDMVRAYRAAFLRALADLEYEVRATMPRRPVPAEPSYARRTVDPARCGHALVADIDSDYLSCPDCGLAVADMAPRQMTLIDQATEQSARASGVGAAVRAACPHLPEHVSRAALLPGKWYCHQCGACLPLDELIG